MNMFTKIGRLQLLEPRNITPIDLYSLNKGGGKKEKDRNKLMGAPVGLCSLSCWPFPMKWERHDWFDQFKKQYMLSGTTV